MHKLASFLQRNSSDDTVNSDIVSDRKESIESIEHDKELLVAKQEEFHKMVLLYIMNSDNYDNDNNKMNESDIYNNEILNCLRWFIKESGVPSSMEKDLKLYLKKSVAIFAGIYNKYHTEIINYYHFSFIPYHDQKNECLSLLEHDRHHIIKYKNNWMDPDDGAELIWPCKHRNINITIR